MVGQWTLNPLIMVRIHVSQFQKLWRVNRIVDSEMIINYYYEKKQKTNHNF